MCGYDYVDALQSSSKRVGVKLPDTRTEKYSWQKDGEEVTPYRRASIKLNNLKGI